MTDASYDHEGLKVPARDLRRPVETLVAQSLISDPFYADRPGWRPKNFRGQKCVKEES